MFRVITLNINIKLSNNKTKAILLNRIKRPIVRLLSLLLLLLLSLKYEKWEDLDWTKKFLLSKIPTDPWHFKRFTGISKRDREKETRYTLEEVSSWILIVF